MGLLLSVALLLFISFTVAHYTLSQLWNNADGILATSAIFAVLVLMFKGQLGL